MATTNTPEIPEENSSENTSEEIPPSAETELDPDPQTEDPTSSSWTPENIDQLLEVLNKISSNQDLHKEILEEVSKELEPQQSYYKQFDILTKEEYDIKLAKELEEQKTLDQEQQKELEANAKLMQQRHKEIVDALEQVKESSSSEVTSTLSQDFKDFSDQNAKQTEDMNIFMWVVFLVALMVVGFKTLLGRIQSL